jgi:DNA repair exonuclease SbcCD ATPase subunit
MPRLGSVWMLLTVAMLPAAAMAQGAMTYCCTDDGGKKVCSDVLPKQCYGRAYREINAQGVTTRRIDAPLSAEQRAQKEADAKKAKEEEVRRLEQDRKNRALLATYPTEQDIDYARDRAVADIDKAVNELQEKQAELTKRKKQLEAEAEFYKKKPMPPQLQAQMRENEAEMKVQQAAVEGKQKEIATVKSRYEEEKTRYRELTKRKAEGGVGASVQVPAGADSRPR